MEKKLLFACMCVFGMLATTAGLAAPPLTATNLEKAALEKASSGRDRGDASKMRSQAAPTTTPDAAPSEPTPATASPASSRIDENYALRPGDRVSFAVEEDRKPPLELVILASGELEIPHIGRFHVAGKTCRAVSLQLKGELERRYYKTATVIIGLNQVNLVGPGAAAATAGMSPTGVANIRVYFNGAVATTGAKEFPGDTAMTVSKAILIAGGFRDFANQKKVQLIRKATAGKSQIMVVNVQDLLHGKPGNDPVLQAEDMIYVPERLFNF